MRHQFKIRGCSGLGAQFYTRMVAKHYSQIEPNVIVETQYPEVFADLQGVKTTDERIFDPEIYCTYVPFKTDRNTTQYKDVLRAAQIKDFTPLSFGAKLDIPRGIKRRIEESKTLHGGAKVGWPVCVVADIYTASGIRNKETLRPNIEIYSKIVDAINKSYFTVLVGAGDCIVKNADCSLKGGTNVNELMGLVCNCDLVLTQVGALLPMGEAFGKRTISVLSANYGKSGDVFLNTITPKKVVCSNTSVCYRDDLVFIVDRVKEMI